MLDADRLEYFLKEITLLRLDHETPRGKLLHIALIALPCSLISECLVLGLVDLALFLAGHLALMRAAIKHAYRPDPVLQE